MKDRAKVKLFVLGSVALITFVVSNMAIAEPKGVAHKVEALAAQLLEMNNELTLIKQENIQLSKAINQLINRVEALSDVNTELSEKIACIDSSSSTDELLAIACDVTISNNDTSYSKLTVEGDIETENIYGKENNELNIESSEFINIYALETIIESRDKILLKTGKSELTMKKNGDILLEHINKGFRPYTSQGTKD